MTIYVKTAPGLKFRLQGRLINENEYTAVHEDHAVTCLIRDGGLIVKSEVVVKKDAVSTIKQEKQVSENKNIKGRISDVKS